MSYESMKPYYWCRLHDCELRDCSCQEEASAPAAYARGHAKGLEALEVARRRIAAEARGTQLGGVVQVTYSQALSIIEDVIASAPTYAIEPLQTAQQLPATGEEDMERMVAETANLVERLGRVRDQGYAAGLEAAHGAVDRVLREIPDEAARLLALAAIRALIPTAAAPAPPPSDIPDDVRAAAKRAWDAAIAWAVAEMRKGQDNQECLAKVARETNPDGPMASWHTGRAAILDGWANGIDARAPSVRTDQLAAVWDAIRAREAGR